MNRPLGNPLDILILGQAGAGKTALLQALLIVSKNRPECLGGTLTPLAITGLALPRYRYEPSADSDLPAALPVTFAELNLPDQDAAPVKPGGPLLGNADLERADALVLVLDAALPDEELRKAFAVALRLIDRLQDRRRSTLAVGGFPVAVALTQCDLLADHLINHDAWLTSVDARAKHLKDLFGEAYAESDAGGFGSIALEIYPTATHLPDTTEKRADRDEPYGVAPLFRDLFEAAYEHDARELASGRRLNRILISTAAALLLLAGVTAVLLLSAADPVQLALEAKLDGFQAREGQTATARLANGQLNRKRSELLELRHDPEFDKLPADKRAALSKSLDEIEAYIHLKEDLARLSPPMKVRSLEELTRLADSLKALPVPKNYEQDWAQTDAVQTRGRYLAEIPELRAAVSAVRQFYGSLKNRANALLFAGEIQPLWEADVQKLRKDAEVPLFPPEERLKRAALDFREVETLRGEWNRALDRLRLVYDLAAALGITGDAGTGTATLLLAEGDVQAADPMRRLADRLAVLKRQFPGYENWVLAAVPDVLRPQFQNRLARAIVLSNSMGQRLLAGQMKSLNPTGPEKPADWPRAAEWLLAPGQRDFREFHQTLRRIQDPAAEDACELFARFATARSFPINPKAFKLFVPYSISEVLVRPAGKLSILHRPTGSERTANAAFKQEGDGLRERSGTTYLFVADGAAIGFNYVPGDALSAELPVKEGEKAWQFSWVRSRTATFQFERLLNPPRYIDPAKGAGSGSEVEGVTLTVVDGSIPGVPDLLPAVRFQN